MMINIFFMEVKIVKCLIIFFFEYLKKKMERERNEVFFYL